MQYIIDAEGFAAYLKGHTQQDIANIANVMSETMLKGNKPKVEWLTKITRNSNGKRKGNKRKVMNRYSPEFEEFWQIYPKVRRMGKGAAYKVWQRFDDTALLLKTCQEALEWQPRLEQWKKGDKGEFIPLPATYLNQYRFNDEKPNYLKTKSIPKAY